MKKKMKIILIIASVIILILGIIVGISVSNELISYTTTKDNLIVDGTNVSGITEIIGLLGSKIIGTLIIFASIGVDIIIWILYGIVILTIKLMKVVKNRKNEI